MLLPKYHRNTILARNHERFVRQAAAAGTSATESATNADVSAASSTATATGSAAASPSGTCGYDGSVSTYVSCERAKISTTELVAGGFGVLVGIGVLAAACVMGTKMWKRRRGAVAGRKMTTETTDRSLKPLKAANLEKGEDAESESLEGAESDYGEEDEEDQEEYVKKPLPTEKTPLPTEKKGASASKSDRSTVRPRSATVESITDEEEVPGRSQRLNIIPPSKQNSHGSPVETQPVRTLYPLNPSPQPRHLQARPIPKAPQRLSTPHSHSDRLTPARAQPRPPSALRTPQAHRQSRASVRFTSKPPDDVPPLPVPTLRPPLASGGTFDTPPDSRNSIASTVGIPSYYQSEALEASMKYYLAGGAPQTVPAVPNDRQIPRVERQGGGARPASRVEKHAVGNPAPRDLGNGTEVTAPVPSSAERPWLSERRPSAGGPSTGAAGGRRAPQRRPSEGRGGMI